MIKVPFKPSNPTLWFFLDLSQTLPLTNPFLGLTDILHLLSNLITSSVFPRLGSAPLCPHVDSYYACLKSRSISPCTILTVCCFFLILTPGHFFIAFRERGRKREKHRCKREALMWVRNIDWLLPICTCTGDHTCSYWDGTCNLGMCPELESNPQPFGYGMVLQPTESRQPGTILTSVVHVKKFCYIIWVLCTCAQKINFLLLLPPIIQSWTGSISRVAVYCLKY